MKKTILKIVNGIIIGLIWLVVWFALALVVNNELLLPTPVVVAKALLALLGKNSFYLSMLRSIYTILLGVILANIAGILLGTASAFWKPVKSFLSPVVTAIKATPVASFIILVLIWIGKDGTPTLIAFLMVFPVIYQNVITGLLSADKKLVEMGNLYRMTTAEKARFIYVPSAFPSYIASVKTGIGLGWKAGVAAEVLCNSKNTFGGAVWESKLYLEVPELFAWTMAIIIVSLIIEKLAVIGLKAVMNRWTKEA